MNTSASTKPPETTTISPSPTTLNLHATTTFTMHSALVRIQNSFGYFTSVVSFLAILAALSSFTIPQAPSGTLQLRDIKVAKGRPHYHSTRREEYAHVRFNLDMGKSLTPPQPPKLTKTTDLSSLYSWVSTPTTPLSPVTNKNLRTPNKYSYT